MFGKCRGRYYLSIQVVPQVQTSVTGAWSIEGCWSEQYYKRDRHCCPSSGRSWTFHGWDLSGWGLYTIRCRPDGAESTHGVWTWGNGAFPVLKIWCVHIQYCNLDCFQQQGTLWAHKWLQNAPLAPQFPPLPSLSNAVSKRPEMTFLCLLCLAGWEWIESAVDVILVTGSVRRNLMMCQMESVVKGIITFHSDSSSSGQVCCGLLEREMNRHRVGRKKRAP